MSNPHHTLATEAHQTATELRFAGDGEGAARARTEAQTQATLAVAYEARTTNLLTLHQTTIHALTNGYGLNDKSAAELDNLTHQIETRLGLGDTK